MSGRRLGAYQITSLLGAGGMGEVYRARDVRLERTVAIKILPGHLSGDMKLRERFQREARAIASLSHPNICPLYDVGCEDGIDYLVMEYLEGVTLAGRLKRGPLPPEQVLQYAIQITDALDSAHRHRVIHRDLKPGNIMLTKTGVKLLDFGLAKIRSDEVGENDNTDTMALTATGTVLGTLPYIAPEQLNGSETDARTDIFALGAVIYEMAAGERAFVGESQAGLIAAILEHEPPSIAKSTGGTLAGLDHVVRDCLRKRPDERWQSAHDILLELKWIAGAGDRPEAAIATAPSKSRKPVFLYWALALVALAAVLLDAGLRSRFRESAASPILSEIAPPVNTRFNLEGPPALSPDGHWLAFPASDRDGKTLLWIRKLDSSAAQSLAGTEGVEYPFWSPDGRAVGFFADGKLKTVSAAGGSPLVVTAAPQPGGGSWGGDGTILFGGDSLKCLERVPATGGDPATAIELDSSKIGVCSRPKILPDGKHFLYQGEAGDPAWAGTYFGSFDEKKGRLLMNEETDAAYAAGFLLYRRGETLLAKAFDPARGTLAGDHYVVAEHVTQNLFAGSFDVSPSGLLIYRSAGVGNKRLAWFDRSGKNLGVTAGTEDYYDVRLSPDGRKLAVNFSTPAGSAYSQIWVEELLRQARLKITTEPNTDHGVPVWSPDGSRIAFAALGGKAEPGIYLKAASGAGADQLLLALPHARDPGHSIWPTSWSRDGRFILFTRGDIVPSEDDIWILPLAGDRQPRCLVRTHGPAYDGQLSPDGRWLAYTSRESGRDDVYVIPFYADGAVRDAAADAGVRCVVSANGGRVPRWRGDSKELYYLSPSGQMIAAEVAKKGVGIEISGTQVLFATTVGAYSFAPYDVTADGTKFVVNQAAEENAVFTLLANWPARLTKQ